MTGPRDIVKRAIGDMYSWSAERVYEPLRLRITGVLSEPDDGNSNWAQLKVAATSPLGTLPGAIDLVLQAA